MSIDSIVKRATAEHIVVQGRENALRELLTEDLSNWIEKVVPESEPVAADPTEAATGTLEESQAGNSLESTQESPAPAQPAPTSEVAADATFQPVAGTPAVESAPAEGSGVESAA
jgi:hypothetical protein